MRPLGAGRGDSESDSPAGGGGGSVGGGGGPPAGSSSSSSKSHDKQSEKEEETIKVYDGNQGLRRKQFRPIHVSRYASVEQVLASALKAFHIVKHPETYFLTDAYDDEAPVQDPNPVLNLKIRDGKRPAVFLRFK